MKTAVSQLLTPGPRIRLRAELPMVPRAGIDGFISPWWGPGHRADQNLKTLLDLARDRDFSVSIYFETLSNGKGREEGQIFDWLLYYLATYRDHPALF